MKHYIICPECDVKREQHEFEVVKTNPYPVEYACPDCRKTFRADETIHPVE